MLILKLFITLLGCVTFSNTKITYRKEPWRKVQLRLVNWHYALKRLELIPFILKEAPYQILQVNYEGGKYKVDQGNELTPTQVKNIPEVNYIASPKDWFTLCMIDPDAPSRLDPKFREWQHWLVGNIPGRNVSAGETLSEYIGSGPPEGTGLHRYLFLLYRQPGKLVFDEPRLTNLSGDNREKFSNRKFAEKYNLGDPIGGNVYQAQWDDYVPLLYTQLGGSSIED